MSQVGFLWILLQWLQPHPRAPTIPSFSLQQYFLNLPAVFGLGSLNPPRFQESLVKASHDNQGCQSDHRRWPGQAMHPLLLGFRAGATLVDSWEFPLRQAFICCHKTFPPVISLSTWKMVAGGSGVQDHYQLHTMLEASLGFTLKQGKL